MDYRSLNPAAENGTKRAGARPRRRNSLANAEPHAPDQLILPLPLHFPPTDQPPEPEPDLMLCPTDEDTEGLSLV